MKRFYLFVIFVLLISSCTRKDIRFVPGPGSAVEVLSLKFVFRQENVHQTGRIHWKFAGGTSSALFLSPVNQVLFELYAQGEESLLINRRERRYWKGDFRALIGHYWNLNLKLTDIRQIIVEGIVPDQVNTDPSVRIESFRDSDRSIERVEISNNESHLTLRILKRETRQGGIISPPALGKFGHRERIEDVIGRS